MKLLIVSLCILAAVIPSALSIECYVCRNTNGDNCVTGKQTCSIFNDGCSKSKTGDIISKGCTIMSVCKAAKEACKQTGECEAWCCDSDGCNGGVPLKPVTFLTLLAMALAIAKYLM